MAVQKVPHCVLSDLNGRKKKDSTLRSITEWDFDFCPHKCFQVTAQHFAPFFFLDGTVNRSPRQEKLPLKVEMGSETLFPLVEKKGSTSRRRGTVFFLPPPPPILAVCLELHTHTFD